MLEKDIKLAIRTMKLEERLTIGEARLLATAILGPEVLTSDRAAVVLRAHTHFGSRLLSLDEWERTLEARAYSASRSIAHPLAEGRSMAVWGKYTYRSEKRRLPRSERLLLLRRFQHVQGGELAYGVLMLAYDRMYHHHENFNLSPLEAAILVPPATTYLIQHPELIKHFLKAIPAEFISPDAHQRLRSFSATPANQNRAQQS